MHSGFTLWNRRCLFISEAMENKRGVLNAPTWMFFGFGTRLILWENQPILLRCS